MCQEYFKNNEQQLIYNVFNITYLFDALRKQNLSFLSI